MDASIFKNLRKPCILFCIYSQWASCFELYCPGKRDTKSGKLFRTIIWCMWHLDNITLIGLIQIWLDAVNWACVYSARLWAVKYLIKSGPDRLRWLFNRAGYELNSIASGQWRHLYGWNYPRCPATMPAGQFWPSWLLLRPRCPTPLLPDLWVSWCPVCECVVPIALIGSQSIVTIPANFIPQSVWIGRGASLWPSAIISWREFVQTWPLMVIIGGVPDWTKEKFDPEGRLLRFLQLCGDSLMWIVMILIVCLTAAIWPEV